jgi:hypothetical protein
MRILALSAALTLLPAGAFASNVSPRTLRVPEDYPTIRAALGAALDHDEILVSPGTYQESMLNFADHSVHLRSIAPEDSLIREQTIIDGGGQSPIMVFTGGYADDSAVSGFTIRGAFSESDDGGAVRISYGAMPTLSYCNFTDNEVGIYRRGSAVYADHASVVMEDCAVFRNRGDSAVFVAGGAPASFCRVRVGPAGVGNGLDLRGTSASLRDCRFIERKTAMSKALALTGPSTVTVEDCIFRDNSTDTMRSGSAIFFNPDVLFECRNTVFIGNIGVSSGGAISSWGASTLIISDCEFRNNLSHGMGGAGWFNHKADVTFLRCTFIDNIASTSGGALAFGAGVQGHLPATGSIRFCIFSGNYAPKYGGALWANHAAVSMDHCIVRDNTGGQGGAVWFNHGGGPFNHCTFVDNTALTSGGTFGASDSDFPYQKAAILNSILRGGAPEELAPADPVLYRVHYSNIEGGWSGVGNIDADPIWDSRLGYDFVLLPGSPCIDSAIGAEDALDWCEIDPRYCNFNGPAPDMGAYGGANSGWLGE